ATRRSTCRRRISDCRCSICRRRGRSRIWTTGSRSSPGSTGIAPGRELTGQRGCAECHGTDGKGKVFIDSPNGLYVKSPNITPGAGEVVAGGKIPRGPPDWPPAEKTVMGPYDTAQKFVAMMRTGKRPDGSDVSQ